MIKDFRDYQRKAALTAAQHPDDMFRISILGLGLAGEAGEVVELVKKYTGHGHDIDPDKVAKELGDVLWYLSNLATEFDLDLAAIATANFEKLAARYPDGFSQDASRNRKEAA